MGDEEEEASMGATRYPVMPSLVALQQMRNRLHLAQLGKKLMKWTALATGKELRRLSMEISTLMQGYREKWRTAFMLLARARYFFPTMNTTVLEGVTKQACVSVTSTPRSVAGVKVKNILLLEMGCDSYKFLGMSKGGMVIKEAKDAWLELLKMMILLCQYRSTFKLIDEANKNATKKQNVLARCVIPRIIITMRYITAELDEQEREESFRLKRFKQLKYKNAVPDKRKKDQDEDENVPKKIPEPKPKPQPEVELKPDPIPASKPEPKREPKCKPIPAPIFVPQPPIIDPLELLMNQIIEVIRLAEELDTEPTPEKEFGLTICALRKLKVQLEKLIEVSEGPIKDRVCSKCGIIGRTVSSCSCQMKLETPKPAQTGDFETPKPEGFVTAMKLMPKSKVKTTISEYILKTRPIHMLDPMAASKPLDLEAMSKNRIEELESHAAHVICMTNRYQCEGLLSKSAEDFLKCWKSVKIKIQESSEKLLNKNDYNIVLSKEAKDIGLVSGEEFICCVEIKTKIEPNNEPKPQVIDNLLFSLNDIISFITKYKDGAFKSDSIEIFYENCETIKAKLDSYKADSTAGCGKGTCPETPPKTPPPESRGSFIKASSHVPSVNSCSAGASVSGQRTVTIRGDESAVSQQSQHSCKSKSTEDSAPPPPPSTEPICVHKQPSTSSCSTQSYQIAPSEKSESPESGRNLFTVFKSQSSAEVKLIPKEKKKKKDPKAGQKANKTTTVRTYTRRKIDGSIVEETKTVTIEQRVYDEQEPPSNTSSWGSCASTGNLLDKDLQKLPSKISWFGPYASGKRADSVNLCKILVKKGPVRNIKSEPLIRDHSSSPCPPFLRSCVSADALISLERSHENETVEQDPFYCASPATSDDDSVSPM